MADTVKRSTARSRFWFAWAGSSHELERIGRELEKLIHQRRERLLVDFDAETDQMVRESEEDGRKLSEYRLTSRSEERQGYETAWQLQCTLSDGSDEIVGPLDDVLPEFDRRQHHRVEFGTIFNSSEYVAVIFDKREDLCVYLRVKSRDQGWGRLVISKMSDEIDAGRPWWWWVHTPFGRAVPALLTYIATWVAINLAFWDEVWNPSKGESLASHTVQASIGAFVPLLGLLIILRTPVRRLLFPHLEFVAEGSPPTGTRFFIFLGTLAISVIAGIWVNLVT